MAIEDNVPRACGAPKKKGNNKFIKGKKIIHMYYPSISACHTTA